MPPFAASPNDPGGWRPRCALRARNVENGPFDLSLLRIAENDLLGPRLTSAQRPVRLLTRPQTNEICCSPVTLTTRAYSMRSRVNSGDNLPVTPNIAFMRKNRTPELTPSEVPAEERGRKTNLRCDFRTS